MFLACAGPIEPLIVNRHVLVKVILIRVLQIIGSNQVVIVIPVIASTGA